MTSTSMLTSATYINTLTSSTAACARIPMHFATDRECIEKIGRTMGKLDPATLRIGRIRNTMELTPLELSVNLRPEIEANPLRCVGEPLPDQRPRRSFSTCFAMTSTSMLTRHLHQHADFIDGGVRAHSDALRDRSGVHREDRPDDGQARSGDAPYRTDPKHDGADAARTEREPAAGDRGESTAMRRGTSTRSASTQKLLHMFRDDIDFDVDAPLTSTR